MNSNVKNVTSKLLLLMGLMLTFSFVSCSSDNETTQTNESEEIAQRFKSVILKKGNLPKFTNAKEGQYFALVRNGEAPCQLFTEITQSATFAIGSYDCKYETEDGTCTIRIKGKKELKGDEILYATMYVKIPQIPEISVIELYSEAILNSENSGMDMDSDSDPFLLP